MQDLHRRADEILQHLLELPANQRSSALNKACSGDHELFALTQRLLGFAAGEDGVEVGGALEDIAGLEDLCGQILGGYRIDQVIGTGGMAVVYSGHRIDGAFEQEVAIKVVRAEYTGAQLERRFAQERQILAALRHPSIASLLDGGVTEDGRPYLVMELVVGATLQQHCLDRDLPLEQRLLLVEQVCEAVAHAHAHLVIHRDIKPTNVLVGEDGRAKLLDFGIAKLLQPDTWPGARTETRPGIRPMTPDYASPEQLQGRPVTTATDVHGLGLLLYELLVGELPGASGTTASMRGSNTAPRVRQLPPPSRHSECMRELPVRTRRELDHIVLMALREDPQRRYPTVNALLLDLRNFRRGRPVMARGDAISYRLRKLVERNKTASGLAVGIAFFGVLAFLLWLQGERRERQQIQQRLTEAQQVSEFIAGLFEVSDPRRSGRRSVNADELLAEAARRLAALEAQPSLQASLMLAMSRLHLTVGRGEEATRLATRALELRRSMYHMDDPEFLAARAQLGSALLTVGDLEAAGVELEAAASGLRRIDASLVDSTQLTRVLGQLADQRKRVGDYARAQSIYEEALDLAGPEPDAERVELLNGYGLLLDVAGERTNARAAFEEALQILEQMSGPTEASRADVLDNLGHVERRLGDANTALRMHEQALEIRRRTFGEAHASTAASLNSVGVVLRSLGDEARAKTLFEASVRSFERSVGPEHHLIAYPILALANIEAAQGRRDRAADYYARALEIRRAALGEQHPMVAATLTDFALFVASGGDTARAEALFVEALEIRRRTQPAGHTGLARNLVALGELLLAQGRHVEAEPMFEEALRILEQGLPPGHYRIDRARELLARTRS